MYKIFLEYFQSLTKEEKEMLLKKLYIESSGSLPLPLH